MRNLSFRLGIIMLGGFVLLQLMVVIALALPGRGSDRMWYGLPSPPAMAALVDAMEMAGPKGQRALADSYGGGLFAVEIADRAPDHFMEIPQVMQDAASAYRAALASHNVIVDGGPGWFNRWLTGRRPHVMRLAIPIRITVWLRDGRVLILTGRPSPGLRAFLYQRSLLGLAGGAVLMLVLFVALRQITRPLVRLTHDVRAFGADLSAPDARVEGSAETRGLATAFNDMKGRITRLLEERTFILAGIAHDLRTYLTRLRLRADFIDDPEQRTRAESDLDQMGALLDDSLLFAGLAQGSVRPVALVDLRLLCVEERESRPDAERIEVMMSPSIFVRGDPAGLSRIFNNLADNALRYAEQVTVAALADGMTVRWRFDDDGPGVPANAMPMLGQAFARVDASRDRRTGGTGLGLAIVRALAEAMGGRIAFTKAPAGGLRVEISLPLADTR